VREVLAAFAEMLASLHRFDANGRGRARQAAEERQQVYAAGGREGARNGKEKETKVEAKQQEEGQRRVGEGEQGGQPAPSGKEEEGGARPSIETVQTAAISEAEIQHRRRNRNRLHNVRGLSDIFLSRREEPKAAPPAWYLA
jgi:hypothetical protein